MATREKIKLTSYNELLGINNEMISEIDINKLHQFKNHPFSVVDNEKMLEVLNEFKELSDAGYFGEDWIGTDSTNMSNEFGDRTCAMAMANSSYIKQIKDDTGSED